MRLLIHKEACNTTKEKLKKNSEVAISGDIDGDGFDDLAVGSPYEDNGAGAVRIYYGKKRLSGIQDSLQVSQKRIPLLQLVWFPFDVVKMKGKIGKN